MIAKYKYFSSGCIREMLVDVELVNDMYIDDDQCKYSGDDLEFINYNPFIQYNDMLFNTHEILLSIS